ncbi:chromosome segregation protein SMC [Candidatus Igneacidithiobacillus taiwanensis]|uniref:chromosome segregation protein SMC n=1 Tax=Candidatus Igneacidithiobacillus taiwanensis TaxID=1945924 RepID=UPI0028A277A2|nr:chromosome segregation protein SMC [Candidatus Igneacidithiobacillus taiwanensis]
MRLTAIHLHGFKSFRNATRIELQRNPLVIVGPNGCGKSNIIDAIRWVLGESSARQMRGAAMADVISNGAANRAPAQQAIVELLFDNSDAQAPSPWTQTAEIRVQRRLTRDGDSQYRINDARCRRRDVGDLFLGTGLGASAYAIIEQGTIGRIIESRPEDLRAMLEEAGGISRYKERRRETEQRIAETREHLQRLRDIHGEMDQQFQRLTRQAGQARQLRELRAEERRWQWWDLTLRIEQLEGELADYRQGIAQRRTALAAANQREQALQQALADSATALAAHEEQLRSAQAEHYAAQAEQTLAEQNWQRQQTEIQRLIQTRQEEEQRQQRLHSEEQALQRQQQEAKERLQTLIGQESEREAELQRLRSARDTADAAVEAAERQQHQLRDKVQDWRRELEVKETQWRELQPRILELERRRARLQERERLPAQELPRRQERLAQVKAQEEHLRSALGELEAKLGQLAPAIEQQQERWQQARDQQQALRSQRDALQRLRQRLQPVAVQGTPLSHLLQVDADWEYAVELFLQNRLHAVLAEEAEIPQGVGSWLWPADESPEPELPPDALWHRLQIEPGWHRALLPWFYGLRCVPDLQQAEARRAELRIGEHWITPRAELRSAHGLWRLGGEQEDASWLRVQRELQGIEAQLPALEQQVTAEESRLRQLREEHSKARGEEQELRRRLQAQQAELSRAQQELMQWESRLAAEAQRSAEVEEECLRLDTALQELQERARQLDQDLQHQRAREAGLRQQEQQAKQELESRRQEQQNLRQRLGRLRDEEQRAALERQRLQGQENNASERLRGIATERERQQAQAQALANALQQLQAAQPALAEARAAQAARRAAAQEALAALQGVGETLRKQQREFDQERQRLQQSQRQEEIELARLEAECAHREERLQELFIEAERLAEALGENPGAMPEHGQPTAELQRIQAALAKLGNVNLAAEEELAELQARQGDLAAQVADVDSALQSLEAAMAAMDAETLERFQHTLQHVNQGLQRYFAELFGGGTAALERCEGDPLSAGLILRAQPPGKRNGTLQQLSGGEKALTAIALVFAIFALNPAPFCILDEVDAPLDDANIERFCRLLRSLAEQTQFLLISHRQLTLQVAEQLVGVTMIEPGISSIVPVDVAALLSEDAISAADDKVRVS